ncbi:glycerol-3-phosphate acyltransferase PlsX [Bradyrhizobium algeriense]|uniref:Phosphate acyltransferase n=1 Tax=Bradyrhizobium algeriense TaxID=634784 RepID=A0ABU8B6D2_9BRAD
MPEKIRIALDCMGGDFGAPVALAGAELSLKRLSNVEFLAFGDLATVEPLITTRPQLHRLTRIVHSEVVIRMDQKPAEALRHGRSKSSMALAIDAIKRKEADFAISAGNTGALMALAKIKLRTTDGIARPALAALWPSLKGETVVLDLGASIGADAEHLFNLAVMGGAMARTALKIDRPTVGMLGSYFSQFDRQHHAYAADQLLRDTQLPGLNYIGFVEGCDIGSGRVDVVVTEAFAGNVALKSAEGTARLIQKSLQGAMRSSWSSRVGYLLARGSFSMLRTKLRPPNGAMFLGLNGTVIKSHGSADAASFADAIAFGCKMVRAGVHSSIQQLIQPVPV